MKAIRMTERMYQESVGTGDVHFMEDSIVDLDIESVQIPTQEIYEANTDLFLFGDGKWWLADGIVNGRVTGDQAKHFGKLVMQSGKIREVPDTYLGGVRPLLKVKNLSKLHIYEGELVIIGEYPFYVLDDEYVMCGGNVGYCKFMGDTDDVHNVKNSKALELAKKWVVDNQDIMKRAKAK